MILAGFWMISMYFGGFSHGFGAENQGKLRKIKEIQGKLWKIREKQVKSTNIDRRSSLLLLKTVLHSCQRDLNMFLDGVLPFLGGLGAVFDEKSWKIIENDRKIIEQTRKINES